MTPLTDRVSEVLDGLKPWFNSPQVAWHEGYAVVYDHGRHIIHPTSNRPPMPSWVNAPNYVEPHPEDTERGLCPDTGRKVPSCVVNWGCQRIECKAEQAEHRRLWLKNRKSQTRIESNRNANGRHYRAHGVMVRDSDPNIEDDDRWIDSMENV